MITTYIAIFICTLAFITGLVIIVFANKISMFVYDLNHFIYEAILSIIRLDEDRIQEIVEFILRPIFFTWMCRISGILIIIFAVFVIIQLIS